MCADIIPEEIASDGTLKRQSIHLVRDSEHVPCIDYVANVCDLLSAITSLEGIVMAGVHPASRRKYAWIQIGRTYFYSMLYATWLTLRSHFDALTDTEHRIHHMLESTSDISSSVLPSSIANEILRITIPIFNQRTRMTLFPCIRSGLLLSRLSTDPATGLRTRHVQITTDYKRLPSVRISQNMIWLLVNRNSSSSRGLSTNAILCALLNGSFEPTTFITNNGSIAEETLLKLLCANPALNVPLACTPDAYAKAFDLIESDTTARPINHSDNEPIFDFLPPAWLEPQLNPTSFDAGRAISGIFVAFDKSLDTFSQLEIPTATISSNDLDEHIEYFGPRLQQREPNYNPYFWIDAIRTRATGSA